MTIVAIGMNLLLAVLLLAALALGWRLNLRLKALKDSHAGFAKAVADLDAAAARAEQGLADLRAATDDAIDALADRIAKARELSAKLDRQVDRRTESPARRVEPREAPDLEDDVTRVAQRLGSLLSGVREPRPRPLPPVELELRREPARRRPPVLDDDLFEDAPAQRAGGRR